LSFDVPAGRKLALVGASGCGKSTVVNLLLRFWDVDRGRVRLGDFDVRDFPLEDLRARITVVSQRTMIFNMSIRENLRLGNPDADDAQIEHAARLANLHGFITSLPDGYATQLGEMGVKLSGGQRQRLAIARSLLKDAPVLILDEATSNLDVENEREIQGAIQRLTQGRTTLVIAHRLSTVINADAILVMDQGRIVGRGSHAELLAAGGVYARLLAHQGEPQ
jgi:ABC-type multidrug transport system fused ATPase/permease subunit